MTAESIVYDTLRLDPGVAAVITVDEDGDTTEPRIFPDVAPLEFAWPMIVYGRTSSVPTFTIHGGVAALDVTMNVTCWARTRPAAESLADSVAAAMSAAGHVFVDRRAGYDAEADGYAAAIDFTIWEL